MYYKPLKKKQIDVVVSRVLLLTRFLLHYYYR